jgi:CHAT domain-containing protein
LPLAGGGRLTVSDILTLHRVPATVVLLGCAAAANEHGVSSTTLGVAQAFLLAGANLAVAPVRNVEDGLSADLAARMYEALAREPGLDVARAAREALLELAKVDATGGWAAFRVTRR